MRNATFILPIFCFLLAIPILAMESVAADDQDLAGALQLFYQELGEGVLPDSIQVQIARADEYDAIGKVMNQGQLFRPMVRKSRAKYSNTALKGNKQKQEAVSGECKLWPQVNNKEEDPREFAKKDAANFIVERKGRAVAMLNRFPYAVCQLLLLCKSHVRLYDNLSENEQQEVDELTAGWIKRMQEVCGFNDFVCFSNEGHACTGGTIPDHWHRHLFPRYDCSRAIERSIFEAVTKAERASLYEAFLALAQTGRSEKLKKVYQLYGSVLQVAQKRAEGNKKTEHSACRLCDVMKNKQHPVHTFILADTNDFTVYLNPEGAFLGEVMFVFKDHNTPRHLLDKKSATQFSEYMTKIQKILREKMPLNGFSCSESNRGGHSVSVVRPRTVPQIFTGGLEMGVLGVCGDPDQLYTDVKAELEGLERVEEVA